MRGIKSICPHDLCTSVEINIWKNMERKFLHLLFGLFVCMVSNNVSAHDIACTRGQEPCACKNCITLSLDSIVVTSHYIENELDSCLGYHELTIVKNDSTSVLTGLYIKRKSGLWLGFSAPSDITEANIQDNYNGISAVLTFLSKYEAIENLEGMQIDLPYNIAVEVTKICSSNQKWNNKKEKIKKLILNSYYIAKLNKCLKEYSLQIDDLSMGHVVMNDVSSKNVLSKKLPKRIAEIELFLEISH